MCNITNDLNDWLRSEDVGSGLVTILARHTSASLTIQENADPDVQTDLVNWLDDLAPETRSWRHSAEGPDDMPAHAKSVVSNVTLSIPVVSGQMDLGTWQGVFLMEHPARGSNRTVSIVYQGT